MRSYLKCLFGVIASMAMAIPAQAQPVYDANVTTGADGAFFNSIPHAMQVITIASAPAQPMQITNFTLFGVRYNTTTVTTSGLFLNFWTNVDTSPGSTDALATATLAGSVGYNLPAAGAGSYNFSLPSVNVTVPGNTFAVEVIFTNTAGTAFSTDIAGRYSTGTPTLGSNDGFVYQDSNLDDVFTGAERTQFNGSVSGTPIATNYRMAFSATAVPEPGSMALCGGAVLLAGLYRRRRAGKA